MPILRFFGRRKIHNNQIIGKPAREIPGTNCYLLTLNGAKKLLKAAHAEYFEITLLATKIPIVAQKRFLGSTIQTGARRR